MKTKTLKYITALLLGIYLPLVLSVNFWHLDDFGNNQALEYHAHDAGEAHSSADDTCLICTFINGHNLSFFEFVINQTEQVLSDGSAHPFIAHIGFSSSRLRGPPLS